MKQEKNSSERKCLAINGDLEFFNALLELISVLLADWAEKNGVALEFIQPGKPTQNSYIERFNRTYREEVLDFYLFRSLTEVKKITENWLMQYNEERPHESLGNLTPAEFLMKNSPKDVSTFGWY